MHLIHLPNQISKLGLAYLKRAHNTYINLGLRKSSNTKPIYNKVLEAHVIHWILYWKWKTGLYG